MYIFIFPFVSCNLISVATRAKTFFCFPNSKNVSRAAKLGNICIRNNVSKFRQALTLRLYAHWSCHQNGKCGNFMLLFCRGRHGLVHECIFQGLSGNTWSVFIKFCFAAFSFKANVNFDCVNRAEVQLGIIIKTLHKKINTFGYFYYMHRWSILVKQYFILLSPGKIIVPIRAIFFLCNFKSALSIKQKLIKPQVTDSLEGWRYRYRYRYRGWGWPSGRFKHSADSLAFVARPEILTRVFFFRMVLKYKDKDIATLDDIQKLKAKDLRDILSSETEAKRSAILLLRRTLQGA